MKYSTFNRRKFIKYTSGTAAAMGLISALPHNIFATPAPLANEEIILEEEKIKRIYSEPRIRFAVIGINHNHIISQVDAVIRGGGQLVSLYAKEANLITDFIKKYPQVKVAGSEKEILEDKTIQLILSSAIPVNRAAIGIRVMQHGK
ncbi:MAG: twin-arginine translocation signal domain-containing protein, partial [Ginsengibacter sp.]